jgi:hypothetical protein
MLYLVVFVYFLFHQTGSACDLQQPRKIARYVFHSANEVFFFVQFKTRPLLQMLESFCQF